MSDEMLNNIAKTLNVAPETVRARADEVLAEQGAAWRNAGRSEEDCFILALRVAGRNITSENARLRRARADTYEGMFISVPRPKEWGKILYNKMKNQLTTASAEVRQTFVDNGSVVLFEDNHDGSYTRLSAEQYGQAESDVSSLPKHTMQLDSNTHFYVVWDKNNPTFPSGDANFKYGQPRPQDERERTCLFYGRMVGSNDLQLIQVSGSGKAADNQFPTFTPLTIPLRTGKNGRAYLNADVSKPTINLDLASMYEGSPLDMLPALIGEENILPSLSALGQYYDQYNGTDGWWDRMCATVVEVNHIDPRDKGGCILVCGDTDLMSMAGTIDIYCDDIPPLGVGSQLLVVGQAWRTREDEDRMTVNGWWPSNVVEPMVEPSASDDDGWE
tara:strand:+ start:1046 stop:2209 length:1164 start_codon:yes stop_codon:yes gene_type:complete